MPPRFLDLLRRRRADGLSRQLWGKHRGIVIESIDPFAIARLKVEVPDVFGPGMGVWALPCFPDSRLESYAPPQIGSKVWVEFENGDPARPIWTGFFWTN